MSVCVHIYIYILPSGFLQDLSNGLSMAFSNRLSFGDFRKRHYRPRVDGPRASVTVFAACDVCFPNVGETSECTILE